MKNSESCSTVSSEKVNESLLVKEFKSFFFFFFFEISYALVQFFFIASEVEVEVDYCHQKLKV